MVKRYLLFSFAFLISAASSAQGKIPPFRMLMSDGTLFSATQLPIGKPVMIYYFSPECEDCAKFTGEMLARINDFSNVSIAMITYQATPEVAGYVKKNHLRNYANIYVGTEGSSLFVRNYYNIMHFPFVALFTKDGKLVKTYTSKEVSVDDLLARLKAMK